VEVFVVAIKVHQFYDHGLCALLIVVLNETVHPSSPTVGGLLGISLHGEYYLNGFTSQVVPQLRIGDL
jgi:hypothetical protein